CATEFVSARNLPRTLFAQIHERLSGCDLFSHGCRINSGHDDVGRQRTARSFELEGLLLDLARQCAVGEEGRTEEIERIACLCLRDKYILDECLLRQHG